MRLNKKSRLINRYKENAEMLFSNRLYKEAIYYYSLVLELEFNNKEAKIGAMLCDLAFDNEEEAIALFDYYLIIKKDSLESDEILENMIKTFDGSLDELGSIFSESLKLKAQYGDGIEYSDFKELVNRRGSFKRAFEDIMFSTKVIILGKEDFLDFLNSLIENGFQEMALSYLENANIVLSADKDVRALFDKISERKKVEDRNQ